MLAKEGAQKKTMHTEKKPEHVEKKPANIEKKPVNIDYNVSFCKASVCF
jgi:hypothetical protein